MSEPLWPVPLAGYCDVCGHEALALVVYPTHRVVVHVPAVRSCTVGNPTSSELPEGHYRRVPQPRRKAA
jgi:hypothetical protein